MLKIKIDDVLAEFDRQKSGAGVTFFGSLWVPKTRELARQYIEAELTRTIDGKDATLTDIDEALKAANGTIASTSQRSAVVTGAMALLTASHVVIWINALNKSAFGAGLGVLVGGGLLALGTLVVMSTLWLHWASDPSIYESAKREYVRTRLLSYSRAFRVNLSVLLAMVAMGVSVIVGPILQLLGIGFRAAISP